MKKHAFWADLPVRSVSLTSSCSSFEPSGVIASVSGTCVSCYYHSNGGCHNAVAANVRLAKMIEPTEETLAESLFM